MTIHAKGNNKRHPSWVSAVIAVSSRSIAPFSGRTDGIGQTRRPPQSTDEDPKSR